MELQEIKEKAAPVFKHYGVLSASVFGSISRGESAPKSDIDILVKIGEKMDLVKYIQFRNALAQSLGKSVDVVTESSVSPYLKPYIASDLQPIYES